MQTGPEFLTLVSCTLYLPLLLCLLGGKDACFSLRSTPLWLSRHGVTRTQVMDDEALMILPAESISLQTQSLRPWPACRQTLGQSLGLWAPDCPLLHIDSQRQASSDCLLGPSSHINRTAIGYYTFWAPAHLLPNKDLQDFSALSGSSSVDCGHVLLDEFPLRIFIFLKQTFCADPCILLNTYQF